MKKLVFMLAIAVITLQSCENSQAKSKGNDKGGTVIPVSTDSEVHGTEGGSIKLTKATFLKEVWDYQNSPKVWVYKGDKPAIIDFYADWCGPCKIASPILEEISKEYAGKINVYKINTDAERELSSIFGIQGIPAFLYIPKNGKPVMMSGIARSKEETKQMFKDNINKYLFAAN